jgi:hypothetical protein
MQYMHKYQNYGHIETKVNISRLSEAKQNQSDMEVKLFFMN